jgi:dienelactone hydrolase
MQRTPIKALFAMKPWQKLGRLWKNLARACAALWATAATLGQSGCALHLPQRCCQDVAAESTPRIFLSTLKDNFMPLNEGGRVLYKCIVLPADGDAAAARNRPVLVLHEYDHLSIACLNFAIRLSRAGFTVYVPLLFGKADGKTGVGTTLSTTAELALSGQWHALFAEHQSQPITKSLGELCHTISSWHNDRGIAVIGMCLTGALPISLMRQRCVVAPVIAQPSIPLFGFTPEAKRAFGVSKEDLDVAVRRVKEEHLRVFGTRYEQDTISPKERLEAIAAAFGKEYFCNRTIKATNYLESRWGLTTKAHATLTLCYKDDPDDYPPRRLFLELVTFLKNQLQEHSDLSGD